MLDALQRAPGDIMVLGAAGKMGPSLVAMACRALAAVGSSSRVIAVSRFTDATSEQRLADAGARTVRCDLLDAHAVAGLPEAPNVVFMAGQKFGTSTSPERTWAMNVIVPSLIAPRLDGARTAVFSTGNVYALTPIARGGAREADPPGPIGDYAWSCLGRERVFEYYALAHRTPTAILRVNYAHDLRYGVLSDIALSVFRGEPVRLTMGAVNVIWQGDANAWALQSLALVSTPAIVLNLTGAETLHVRAVAERFGELLGRPPRFEGEEAPDALLSNAARARELFGPPTVPTDQLLQWTADWIRRGGRLLDKPTQFGERTGRF